MLDEKLVAATIRTLSPSLSRLGSRPGARDWVSKPVGRYAPAACVTYTRARLCSWTPSSTTAGAMNRRSLRNLLRPAPAASTATRAERASNASQGRQSSSRSVVGAVVDDQVGDRDADPRVAQQKKAFRRWCNSHLMSRNLKVEHILNDWEDGLLLINLLELVTGKQIPKYNKKPKLKAQKLENLSLAIAFIQSNGVVLVNVGSDDVHTGNQSIILGLIWSILLEWGLKVRTTPALLAWVNAVLRTLDPVCVSPSTLTFSRVELQSFRVEWEAAEKAGSYVVRVESPSDSSFVPIERTTTETFLEVRDEGLEPDTTYEVSVTAVLSPAERVRVKNFTTDWSDGKRFADLVNAMFPGSVLVDERDTEEGRLDQAFEQASLNMGVHRLLDPEDVFMHPDEKSIITYVSGYYDAMIKDFPMPSERDPREEGRAPPGKRVAVTTAALRVPEAPTLDNITETSVRVTWPAVPGATEYRVVVQSLADGEAVVRLKPTSFATPNLKPGTLYTFRVAALLSTSAKVGNGVLGASASCTTDLAPLTVAPDAVSDSTASDSLSVEWASVPNASGYDVRVRSVADGALVRVERVADSRARVARLDPSTAYQIDVAVCFERDHRDGERETKTTVFGPSVTLSTADASARKPSLLPSDPPSKSRQESVVSGSTRKISFLRAESAIPRKESLAGPSPPPRKESTTMASATPAHLRKGSTALGSSTSLPGIPPIGQLRKGSSAFGSTTSSIRPPSEEFPDDVATRNKPSSVATQLVRASQQQGSTASGIRPPSEEYFPMSEDEIEPPSEDYHDTSVTAVSGTATGRAVRTVQAAAAARPMSAKAHRKSMALLDEGAIEARMSRAATEALRDEAEHEPTKKIPPLPRHGLEISDDLFKNIKLDHQHGTAIRLASLMEDAFFSSASILRGFRWTPQKNDVVLSASPRCGQSLVMRTIRLLGAKTKQEMKIVVGAPEFTAPWVECKMVDEDPACLTNEQPGAFRVFRTTMSHSSLSGNLDRSGAKYVAVLRNPVDLRREWYQQIRRTWITSFVRSVGATESEASSLFDASLQPDDFAEVPVTMTQTTVREDRTGEYEQNIRAWVLASMKQRKHLPPNILVLFFEELLANPERTLVKLADFLVPGGYESLDEEKKEFILNATTGEELIKLSRTNSMILSAGQEALLALRRLEEEEESQRESSGLPVRGPKGLLARMAASSGGVSFRGIHSTKGGSSLLVKHAYNRLAASGSNVLAKEHLEKAFGLGIGVQAGEFTSRGLLMIQNIWAPVFYNFEVPANSYEQLYKAMIHEEYPFLDEDATINAVTGVRETVAMKQHGGREHTTLKHQIAVELQGVGTGVGEVLGGVGGAVMSVFEEGKKRSPSTMGRLLGSMAAMRSPDATKHQRALKAVNEL